MQTFLPYKSFKKSAKCLDNKRLGKQRVETLQILQCLDRPNHWKNHPAVKMWNGYENALVLYGMFICNEWLERGFKDTCFLKILKFFDINTTTKFPSFIGSKVFHDSHKSNLLRKNSKHYSKFRWKVSNDLPYYWPSHNMYKR